MTEQPFTQSDPGDSPQSNVWSLRPRMVALIVAAALVAGTLVEASSRACPGPVWRQH
ncbi:hypothetical protein [Nocardia sp. XZ_19_369]|uniref:hypothetical protein n=1 Tax=Nocardia sp. XZ_19_369 TaxID=2769487 RepID=UPI00188FFF0F|nr:hypothetical protein [Nocardia sp. XZ_19_369]